MNLDDLLAKLPIDQIAGQLGVSPDEAAQATRSAIPALVKGMEANAQDPGGAASLQEALGQHASRLGDGGFGADSLDGVDTQDGEKIVNHVFGGNAQQVTQQLGGLPALGGGMVGKLLPMLAPLVMGWLANKFANRNKAQAPAEAGQAPASADQASGGGIGGWLSNILGGGDDAPAQNSGPTSAPGPGGTTQAAADAQAAPAQPAADGGLDLGDLLGGLLGQGRKG